MKKLYVIFNFLVCFLLQAQIVNIPDPVFKAKLLNASVNNITASIGIYPNLTNTTIDTNGDGQIQYSEAEVITYLYLVNSGINDLTGIEAFTNLIELGCSINNLTSINVSQLTHLTGIGCFQNQLTSLDVSNLPNLSIVSCQNNQISTLNIVNTPMLEKVFCSNNQLTSLDFSNNPLFNELDCMNNPNLTSINISNGTTQLLGPQTYYNQCWTGCPSLSRICADSFELSALQTYLSDCGIATAGITFTTSCALNTPDLIVTVNEIKLYPNPNQGLFTVSFASPIDFGTVEVYSMVGQRLAEVSVHNADQVTIQLPHLAAGCYLVKVSSN
ncbi:MAG: T9SS type A sorting domain-containing protein, partial [Flavobacterium sp.]|uniref:T9SS type A sorting domain-containing protein n=1 Tax=Flavobacterium sp. TaxID=239 RepID=UPI0022C43471